MKRASIIIFFSILFFACNKEDSPLEPTIKDKICKVSTAQGDFNNGYIVGSAKVFYDQNNFLTKIESTQDTMFRSFSVVYANDKVILKTKYQGDWTYFLDDKKRVIKASIYTRQNPNGNMNFEFVYNNEGYLSKAVVNDSYTGQQVYNLTYINGNLDKIVGFSSYNTQIDIVFKYDLDKKASLLNSRINPISKIQLPEVLAGFFGKTSINRLLETNETRTNLTYNFGGRDVEAFEYISDKDGNITEVKVNTVNSSFSLGVKEYINSRETLKYKFGYICD